ncbi:MAG: protein phosphatase CheZ [Rhodocyclales bacterium]|nr:protein phosphatase CheZ [Rhodocyclales bacterium]
MSSDSAELEALFDSIAAGAAPAAPAAPAAAPAVPAAAARPPAPTASREVGDSDELQALFDSIAGAPAAVPAPATPAVAAGAATPDEDWEGQEKVFRRVGQMARQLHDTLHELGYDKLITQTVEALPDAKDRLAYIANLTEQAACKVLNATDVANPLLESLESGAQGLASRWDRVYANQMGVEDFKQLAADTRAFLKEQLPQKTGGTKAQLMEIMMAQDFQDLTGQVIKKVVTLAQDLESQLMNALIEVMPEEHKTDSVASLLNGPVINAEGRTDVVVDQQQVDDLLDSLGF